MAYKSTAIEIPATICPAPGTNPAIVSTAPARPSNVPNISPAPIARVATPAPPITLCKTFFPSWSATIGTPYDGHSIRDIAQLATDSETLHPDIAVLAVPGPAAQATAEVIVRAGIHGILNFAPIQLHVPNEVIVRAVNMAAELEVLSYALAHRSER